jgi:hypothetical protein
MWELLTGTLGYDVSNVHVLFADGTDPAPDQSSGANSDWSMIEAAGGNIYSAFESDLEAVLMDLGGTMTTNDDFYFWSYNHGSGSLTEDNTSLVAWIGGGGDGYIQDELFAAWVNPFSVDLEAYVFGQCFAAGMVDDLGITAGDGRFATWAAKANESSWGGGYVDAWADGIDSGLRNTHALAEYAIRHDIYGPDGLRMEHPGYTGADFDLSASSPVSEPSTLLLFGAGLFAIGMLGRMRRKSEKDNSG